MGYYLDRGYRIDEILSLSRDERLFYLAAAQLNETKKYEDMEHVLINAMTQVLNKFVPKGR